MSRSKSSRERSGNLSKRCSRGQEVLYRCWVGGRMLVLLGYRTRKAEQKRRTDGDAGGGGGGQEGGHNEQADEARQEHSEVCVYCAGTHPCSYPSTRVRLLLAFFPLPAACSSNGSIAGRSVVCSCSLPRHRRVCSPPATPSPLNASARRDDKKGRDCFPKSTLRASLDRVAEWAVRVEMVGGANSGSRSSMSLTFT